MCDEVVQLMSFSGKSISMAVHGSLNLGDSIIFMHVNCEGKCNSSGIARNKESLSGIGIFGDTNQANKARVYFRYHLLIWSAQLWRQRVSHSQRQKCGLLFIPSKFLDGWTEEHAYLLCIEAGFFSI